MIVKDYGGSCVLCDVILVVNCVFIFEVLLKMCCTEDLLTVFHNIYTCIILHEINVIISDVCIIEVRY